jgi:hypothetical protein
MSANADVLRGSEAIRSSARECALPQVAVPCATRHWDPEDFAREQIRGLVHRVFFAGGDPPLKQVVFSAAEPNLDVGGICSEVARTLAKQATGQVALVDAGQTAEESNCTRSSFLKTVSIKSRSTRMAANLWRVSRSSLGEYEEQSAAGLHWRPCLEQLRNEFEYVLIQGHAAGISSEAALLGRLTDGIILLLGAGSTRRATARKLKETLEAAQCRILGTVLTGRTFPIPDGIYRRL